MQTIFKPNNKSALTFVFICWSIASQGETIRKSLLCFGLDINSKPTRICAWRGSGLCLVNCLSPSDRIVPGT